VKSGSENYEQNDVLVGSWARIQPQVERMPKLIQIAQRNDWQSPGFSLQLQNDWQLPNYKMGLTKLPDFSKLGVPFGSDDIGGFWAPKKDRIEVTLRHSSGV
jgi:hypothetical protein